MTFVLKCLRHSMYKIFLLANIAIAPEFLSIYRLHPGLDIYTGKIYSTRVYMDNIKKDIKGLIPGKYKPWTEIWTSTRKVYFYRCTLYDTYQVGCRYLYIVHTTDAYVHYWYLFEIWWQLLSKFKFGLIGLAQWPQSTNDRKREKGEGRVFFMIIEFL